VFSVQPSLFSKKQLQRYAISTHLFRHQKPKTLNYFLMSSIKLLDFPNILNKTSPMGILPEVLITEKTSINQNQQK